MVQQYLLYGNTHPDKADVDGRSWPRQPSPVHNDVAHALLQVPQLLVPAVIPAQTGYRLLFSIQEMHSIEDMERYVCQNIFQRHKSDTRSTKQHQAGEIETGTGRDGVGKLRET